MSKTSSSFFNSFAARMLAVMTGMVLAMPAVSGETHIRALLITGGGYHDYEGQQVILTKGINARVPVQWTVDDEAGKRNEAMLSRFKKEDWHKDFDVVVYNMCFAPVKDVEYLERILKPHRDGLPAVVIHCAMHSFRDIDTDEWRKFLGVTSRVHEGHRPFEVKNLEPEHPVMKAFPASWKTPRGELYMIEKVWPDATPLAQAYGQDTKKDHVVIWTNQYGKARVFGTTIGHHNETMAHETYLDFISRGLLWAIGGLGDDGRPLPVASSGDDQGWISLFDGKSLQGWKVGENPGSFQVEDGKIVVDGPRGHLFYVGPVGNADFKNFELKLEVQTYPKANSGVYFRTKYQETGWPSIGYEAQVNANHGDRIKTGSIYGLKNIMDDAPHKDNEWFTYHLIIRDNHFVVKVDGEQVLEYSEPDDVDRSRRPASGTIALQAHDPNSRIYFRNIRVKLLDQENEQKRQAAFVPIFNGKNLEGWDGKEQFWRVENGAIVAETTPDNPTKGNTFLIWRQGEVDDFELRLKYRIDSGWANSGIQFRSEDLGDHVVRGYQADIATEEWITGIGYEERGRGVIARRGQKVEVGDGAGNLKVLEEFGKSEELGKQIKPRDWNEYHLIVRGNQIKQKINGTLIAEFVDTGKTDARSSGILALQLHSGQPMKIHFKDIELKRLPLEGDRKKVVFVAGTPSHGYGNHEHNAGSLLLKRLLDENVPQVLSTVYQNGWPKDPTAFDNADTIVIFSNGGGGHPVLPHLEEVDQLMKQGVGLACLHYAVEVPKGDPGDYFLDWLGGYFEPHWSVNPHWTVQNPKLAENHPITRGVRPYSIYDEWYYHMRFIDDMDGVISVMAAVPPDSTLDRPDGPHSNNPHVRAKKGQLHEVAWGRQRPDGGRGFGFTGAHYHWNWGHPEQRKLVLNAIVWTAGSEVPSKGVESGPLTLEDLLADQDYPKPDNFDLDRVRGQLQEWQAPKVATP